MDSYCMQNCKLNIHNRMTETSCAHTHTHSQQQDVDCWYHACKHTIAHWPPWVIIQHSFYSQKCQLALFNWGEIPHEVAPTYSYLHWCWKWCLKWNVFSEVITRQAERSKNCCKHCLPCRSWYTDSICKLNYHRKACFVQRERCYGPYWAMAVWV